MMKRMSKEAFFSQQRGVSLVVVLLMLIVISILAVSGARFSLLNERSARNDRDREVAFQAAEDALLDAEKDIMGPVGTGATRATMFCETNNSGFTAGCGAGANAGLCTPVLEGTAKDVWLDVSFDDTSSGAKTVKYGQFTGRTYPKDLPGLPKREPRYVVELLKDTGADVAGSLRDASQGKTPQWYRVTAVGVGIREETQVMLQAIVRKAPCGS
jgi:type IV pilus assembly protein PilX